MYMNMEMIHYSPTSLKGHSPLLPVCRHKTHSPVETKQIEPIHPCVYAACLVPKKRWKYYNNNHDSGKKKTYSSINKILTIFVFY